MYNLREIIEKSNIDKIFNGQILFDEPIAPRTTFKIGGNAPVLFAPNDVDSLCILLSFLKKNNIPFFILGGGSNIVVSDEGFEEAVITTCSLKSCSIDFLSADDNIKGDNSTKNNYVILKADSGLSMQSLLNFCIKNNLSGLEEFSGLPGSVGGAVYMNARCFDLSISDVLTSVDYISSKENSNFSQEKYIFDNRDWDYKKSPFMDNSCDKMLNKKAIITSASFKVKKINDTAELKKESIKEKSYFFTQQRILKGHFKFPSAGSVFKNNRDFGSPTGKIIDELGLKGYQIGGAQIAPWHGNIIINKNNATQKDIKKLVDFISLKAYEVKGFRLETEIIFCGK